jgi:hypothetical protein
MDEAEWTINKGAPYEIQYQTNLITGEAVLDTKDVAEKTADPRPTDEPMGDLNAIPLTGFNSMTVTRAFDTEVNARAYSDIKTATKNEIVAKSGVSHRIEYEGQFPGDRNDRQNFDESLDSLVGSPRVPFQTAFPGYTIDGYLLNYDSNYRAETGEKLHQYSLEFIEAVDT